MPTNRCHRNAAGEIARRNRPVIRRRLIGLVLLLILVVVIEWARRRREQRWRAALQLGLATSHQIDVLEPHLLERQMVRQCQLVAAPKVSRLLDRRSRLIVVAIVREQPAEKIFPDPRRQDQSTQERVGRQGWIQIRTKINDLKNDDTKNYFLFTITII